MRNPDMRNISRIKSPSKPKILFMMSFPPPFHGANISNATLWHSQIQQAFECFLLDTSDERDIDNLGKLDWINVKLAFKNLFDLVRLLRRHRFDMAYILVSQSSLGFLRDGLFILLTKAFSKKTKVIIHLRGGYFKTFYQENLWVMRKFIAFTMRRVDAAIVLGQSLKRIFSDWIKDIFVVPNGTDVLLNPNGKNRGPGQANLTILFLSNFMRSKGVIDVVKSAIHVSKKYPQVTYKMAGMWAYDFSINADAGELREEVMDIVASNRLEKVVRFQGVVTGKAKEALLQEAHIFVLPTYYLYEGHPRSIIEAMAAGCPVISTRMGAIPDTVIDHETGFLIAPLKPELLAERIIRLIEDENLRKRMGISARKRYERFYTKDRFIENMMGVFNCMSGK